MKRSKLSRRITWRVLGIILCFNTLIIGAILLFVFEVSLMNSSIRGKYVTDGIAGSLENMMYAAKTGTFNNRLEVEYNMNTPEQVFGSLASPTISKVMADGSKPMPITPTAHTSKYSR